MSAQPAEEAVKALGAQLRGELILPADARYNDARKVYNGMIDKRPALIVRCVDVADVIYAVNFGRDNRLTVAVRGGGHNGPGLGTCDDGLVIDLSRMRGIWVDPSDKTVRVQGGCVWGDVDHATHAFGLAVPSGIIASTGVGGLTLGGGIGSLARTYGLTIDNLLSVDMVLADGKFVTASATENADLFWAVRGGGGNFGVVTSFLFKANSVQTVYGGPMLWPLEKAADVFHFWQDFILKAPNNINGWFAFLTVPPGPPFPEEYHLHKMCSVLWCVPGIWQRARQPSNLFVNSVSLQLISPVQFPGPLCKVYLIRWFRLACNGIGARISSIITMIKPLTCTSNMDLNCLRCFLRCIFILSMAPFSKLVARIPPGVIAMRTLHRSSWRLTRTPKIVNVCRSGLKITGWLYIHIQLAERMST